MHGPTGGPAGGQTSLASGPVYNYSAPFGGNPTVPSPQGTQQTAIGGNISALGPLYQLGGGLNQFTAQQAPTSLNLNLPNYQQMLGASSGNILSKLQGQIPQDVVNQLGQLAAERGVSTGSIGSPNSDAALMRALGLTSLDLQNQGEQQFTGAVGRTPQGAQFNPYSFLVSPEQQQQAQYQANLLNAAPVPSSAQYAGLNALQSGRNAGYGGGFPSSAPLALGSPSSVPSYSGFGAGGTPNPARTGGTAYSSSIEEQTGLPNLSPWMNPNQFQFDTGLPSGTDWQTGMPLPGYAGPQWGGGPFQTEPVYQPYTVPNASGPFPIGGDVTMNQSNPGFDFSQDIDWSNLFGDAGGG